MKYLAAVVLFFFSISSNAQLDNILIENDWYLYSLSIEDQVFIPPVNSEMPYVELNFIDFKSTIIFESRACSIGNGVVIIDENNYTLTFVNGISINLILCNFEENQEFDSIYFDFYSENASNPFNINLLIIDDPESNEELFGLEIVSANGDTAFYNSWLLSNDEFSVSTFKLFPNPVKDKFYISSTNENDFSITIFDITGKLILTKENKKSGESINIQTLKSGIYFISIKDDLGNTSIKRLLKN